MNDQPHNHKKDLEDLLKNFKTDQHSGLDDFEREALEGFNMLNSREEAVKAKTDLDKRINDELFSNEKNNHKVYWFAAAGLFMVIGLSVYFILNNQAIKQNDVAYVQPSENNIPSKEITPLEETSTVSSAPVSVETKAPAENKNYKKIAADRGPSKDVSDKEEALKSRAILKPAQKTNTTAEDIVVDDKRDDADQNDYVSVATGKQVSKDANLENAANTKKTAEAEKNESPNREIAADELAKSEAKVTAQERKKDTRKRFKNKRSEVASFPAAKEDQDTKQPAEKTPSSTSVVSNGSYSKSADNTAANNLGLANNVPKGNAQAAVPAFNEGDKSKADGYNSPTNTCYYSGGEAALTTELRQQLTAKNINKKFDALLNINEKKKVETVVYLNVYDLTKEERDKVTEVLKSLSKFNFYIQPTTKSLFEYKLLYRP